MERPKRKEPPKDDPDYWRAYETLPIAEFFQNWMNNYCSLDWVTVPENTDDGAMLSRTRKTDACGHFNRVVRKADLISVLGSSSHLS
jgi:hypothetical protein